MRAAWYTAKGDASAVLKTGDIEEIEPGADEVQIEIYFSVISPVDISKRVHQPGVGMPFPMVIPDSDGAGVIRKAGERIPVSWLGKRVLCFGAQLYRPFGTAAEYCCVPLALVLELGKHTPMIQAAQMGLPAITGFKAVHKLDGIKGKTILVQCGAGSVAQCAIQFGKRAGAKVIATVNRREEVITAMSAGASEVFILTSKVAPIIRERYPNGIDHIIEVSFGNNLDLDLELLKNGGGIAAYASDSKFPEVDIEQLLFKNISFHFLDCDNITLEDKRAALKEAISALNDGWPGLCVEQVFNLEDIVRAHEYIEQEDPFKHVLITLKEDD